MTNMIFRMYGDQELVAALQGMPDAIQAAVMTKMQEAASKFSAYVKEEKLSGQVLNTRTGALRSSIYARVYSSKSKVTLSSGSRGDVPYAAIHEYGGKTSAHTILPSKASVLAFVMGGTARFARSVNHPGSVMPERSYMRTALAEKQDELITGVTDTILQVARGRS